MNDGVDQFAILRKLRNMMKCDSFNAMAELLGSNSSVTTNVKKGKYKISHRLFLNAAIFMDTSPKKLMKEVGLPEHYFFSKRRCLDAD